MIEPFSPALSVLQRYLWQYCNSESWLPRYSHGLKEAVGNLFWMGLHAPEKSGSQFGGAGDLALSPDAQLAFVAQSMFHQPRLVQQLLPLFLIWDLNIWKVFLTWSGPISKTITTQPSRILLSSETRKWCPKKESFQLWHRGQEILYIWGWFSRPSGVRQMLVYLPSPDLPWPFKPSCDTFKLGLN